MQVDTANIIEILHMCLFRMAFTLVDDRNAEGTGTLSYTIITSGTSTATSKFRDWSLRKIQTSHLPRVPRQHQSSPPAPVLSSYVALQLLSHLEAPTRTSTLAHRSSVVSLFFPILLVDHQPPGHGQTLYHNVPVYLWFHSTLYRYGWPVFWIPWYRAATCIGALRQTRGTGICVCMWRSEADIIYLLSLFTKGFETGSLTEPITHRFGKTDRPMSVCHVPFLELGLQLGWCGITDGEMQIQVLMLRHQSLHWLGQLPSSSEHLWNCVVGETNKNWFCFAQKDTEAQKLWSCDQFHSTHILAKPE